MTWRPEDDEYSHPYLSQAQLRQRAQDLGTMLAQRVTDKYDWREVLEKLADEIRQDLDLGEFRARLSAGRLDPPTFYALCRIIDFNVWEAAYRLGVLPKDPFAWLNRRLRVSSVSRINRYLEAKRPPRYPSVDELDLMFRARLPDGYGVKVQPMDRGTLHRRPYHTYFLFSDQHVGISADVREARKIDARSSVEAVLSDAKVNAHWEPSDDCKPADHRQEMALIYESHFDNRPPDHSQAARGPIVILGAYYSGAKDVAVLVSEGTGLGAIDLSRYVAESLVDTDAFRDDWDVIAASFWAVVESRLAPHMVVTVDDFQSLVAWETNPQLRGKLHAKAFVLELSSEALRYAAYRVACNKRDPCSPAPPDAQVVAYWHNELAAGQKLLRTLAKRSFRVVTFLDVHAPGRPTHGGYPDAVDEMFDQYWALASRIKAELIGR